MAGIQILKLQHMLLISGYETHITTARLCVCVYAADRLETGKAVTLQTLSIATLHIVLPGSNLTLNDGFLSIFGTALMLCRHCDMS